MEVEFKNLILLDYPIVKREITRLRDKSTTPEFFREAVKRLSIILAIEISKKFQLQEIEVETPLQKTKGYRLSQDIILIPILRVGLGMVNGFLEVIPEAKVETPLEKTKGYRLSQDIILIPILRAGLGMVNGFLEVIPEAKVGHIGMERNELTLEPNSYYFKIPSTEGKTKIIILDPMLATGGSVTAAITRLKDNGINNCVFASLVSAPEGIRQVFEKHPEVEIFTTALDNGLNEKGYILPGLGDAGDRTFGTL